ncbi:MAG: NUDIX domain-containing protein [Bacteroidia bacterium]|nr:NUDIX domain-containing protein [Bacteroidia bacterium]NNJ54559.1 NUDIX domain-containing protein [Bacteroidia bacterium]
MIDKFNIRVYGIWIKNNKILISNENIDGFQMTKLPGGGLEFGEGSRDCLKREFKEELDVEIEVLELIHTTDQFIQSTFRKNEQVVAMHYKVASNDAIENYKSVHSTKMGNNNKHQFSWKVLDSLVIDQFTFDMDKMALKKLLNTMG